MENEKILSIKDHLETLYEKQKNQPQLQIINKLTDSNSQNQQQIKIIK